MDTFSLADLKPGEKATIVSIQTSALDVRQRLMEMGLTKGTMVEIIRFAPMGDPIEIAIRGYRLSLRNIEAESVIMMKQ